MFDKITKAKDVRANKLQEMKNVEINLINKTKDEMLLSDIRFNKKRFQVNKDILNDLLALALEDSGTEWITTDNKKIELSADDVKALIKAIRERKNKITMIAREYKDRILNAETQKEIKECVKSISWE